MSPLARCNRLLMDAPPYRCEGCLVLRLEASPVKRAEAFVVYRCESCGAIHEAAAVVSEDPIQSEGL